MKLYTSIRTIGIGAISYGGDDPDGVCRVEYRARQPYCEPHF